MRNHYWSLDSGRLTLTAIVDNEATFEVDLMKDALTAFAVLDLVARFNDQPGQSRDTLHDMTDGLVKHLRWILRPVNRLHAHADTEPDDLRRLIAANLAAWTRGEWGG